MAHSKIIAKSGGSVIDFELAARTKDSQIEDERL
jgi:hypothetical protein